MWLWYIKRLWNWFKCQVIRSLSCFFQPPSIPLWMVFIKFDDIYPTLIWFSFQNIPNSTHGLKRWNFSENLENFRTILFLFHSTAVPMHIMWVEFDALRVHKPFPISVWFIFACFPQNRSDWTMIKNGSIFHRMNLK